MSLVDRANEQILLSQHAPQTWEAREGEWEAGMHPAHLDVDHDSDSSFDPSHWVNFCWTDDEHDSDRIKLTYEEAGLLHDRLGLILGRSGTEAGK